MNETRKPSALIFNTDKLNTGLLNTGLLNTGLARGVVALGALLALLAGSAFSTLEAKKPKRVKAKQYDYNFCGGERVYPRIGVNFSTHCGPRNQIAVGRRGKLMWFFPEAPGRGRTLRGIRKLTVKQLARVSVLAEVVILAEAEKIKPARVIYDMGVNFSARRKKSLMAPYSTRYTPANALYQALLELLPPGQDPFLPQCGKGKTIFNPTRHRLERKKEERRR